MPQVLASLAAALFLAASPVMAQDSASLPSFPDVPRNHFAFEAVHRITGAGLVEGRPDGTFGGSQPVTRYEFAVVMARLFERYRVAHPDMEAAFSDVPRGHWASLALGNASRLGLFEGLPGGKFDGGIPVTRYSGAMSFERAALVIAQGAPEPLPRDSAGRLLTGAQSAPEATAQVAEEFKDVELKHWARSAIAYLYLIGIFEGCPDAQFHGERSLTRYEMAIATARLLDGGAVCVLPPPPQ